MEIVLAFLWIGALVFQIGSVLAALSQPGRRGRAARAGARPPLSILIPTHRTEPEFARRLAELVRLDYPEFEIIIASESDEPEVRRALAAVTPPPHVRIESIVDAAGHTFNPKVNVLVPAYRAARHDLVLMTDDNAVAPPDRLDALVPHLQGNAGLVSAAIVGVKPQGFAAELDAAFMNGYNARYFQAADRLGFAFAIGKTLLFRRRDLDRAGGILALADGMAEDSVLREKLATVGLKTVLAAAPTLQELGAREFGDVYRRHLRWMAHRRSHAPLAFAGELVESSVIPYLIVGAILAERAMGWSPLAGIAVTWLAWLLPDLACTLARRWPCSWRYPLAWTAREALLPAMWFSVLVKRTIRWRGRDVDLHPRALARRVRLDRA